jgi:hypothetical protein
MAGFHRSNCRKQIYLVQKFSVFVIYHFSSWYHHITSNSAGYILNKAGNRIRIIRITAVRFSKSHDLCSNSKIIKFSCVLQKLDSLIIFARSKQFVFEYFRALFYEWSTTCETCLHRAIGETITKYCSTKRHINKRESFLSVKKSMMW